MRTHVLSVITILYVFWLVDANGEFSKTFEKHPTQKEISRPNFVIFFADDIGWGDLGANWSPKKDVTPNLNKLAAEGLRLTDFHAGASVCTPSRSSLLTGRIGLRTGVIRNFVQKSVGGLPLNETTIAEALKPHGYYTGMVDKGSLTARPETGFLGVYGGEGFFQNQFKVIARCKYFNKVYTAHKTLMTFPSKWHLGMTHKYHPRSRGFDFYYGLPWSNDMGCVDVKVWNYPQCKTCPKQPGQGSNVEPVKCGSYYDMAVPLYKDYTIIEQPVDLNALGDHYATQAQTFIESAAKSDKPFLLYVAFAHMHAPMSHAERFTNSTPLGTIYADTLHEMDDVLGRVVSALKKTGLYDNTMTWFTGDNGPWLAKCQFSGDPGPFVGSWLTKTYGGGSTAKCSSWEGGHREPTVVVWPGVVKPNTTSSALTSAHDIFPTILSAAGVPLPRHRRYDGIDLTSFLRGETNNAHQVLYHPNSGDTSPIGEIDTVRMGPYKLFWKTGGTWPDCGGKLAPLVSHDPPIVFDVENDPSESTLLDAASTPDLMQIIANATQLRQNFLSDVKSDNTSNPDYSTSPHALPCCDSTQYYCRCKRDKLFWFPGN